MKVAIVGGGAAGCFAAVNIKAMSGETEVTVYEAGSKLLAKVAVTGGGRCNLTNSFRDVRKLSDAYPRGSRLMGKLFSRFDNKDTSAWFESRGVPLVTQEDQCVFPKSQDAMTIVSLLVEQMKAEGVRVRTESKVSSLIPVADGRGWRVCAGGKDTGEIYDAVLVAVGGTSHDKLTEMLGNLDLEITRTMPSLFSFRVDDVDLKVLTGTVVAHAGVSVPGTKLHASGPLLITDWGMSGPAILKLSSYAAVNLAESEYRCHILIDWFGEKSVQEIREILEAVADANPKKQVSNAFPEIFNSRLWRYLLLKNRINPDSRWCELGDRSMTRLAERLYSDEYAVVGKNRFKSEFVTCGGVALSNLDPRTLESRLHPGLYFAGEVTDVDAITGGFNLQAAWTMAYVAAESVVSHQTKI